MHRFGDITGGVFLHELIFINDLPNEFKCKYINKELPTILVLICGLVKHLVLVKFVSAKFSVGLFSQPPSLVPCSSSYIYLLKVMMSNRFTLHHNYNQTEPNASTSFWLHLMLFALLIFIQTFIKGPWNEVSVSFGWQHIVVGSGSNYRNAIVYFG